LEQKAREYDFNVRYAKAEAEGNLEEMHRLKKEYSEYQQEKKKEFKESFSIFRILSYLMSYRVSQVLMDLFIFPGLSDLVGSVFSSTEL